jgi:glutathione S-transferase
VILVGQYDSPYVRRVAVSLRMLGFSYAHDTRPVFGDSAAIFDRLDRRACGP